MIPQPYRYTRLAVDVTSAHGAVFLFLIPFPEQLAAMGPAISDLFFARMDYLLGRSPTGPDCDAPAARWGHSDALCFIAQDTVPTRTVLVPSTP